MTKEYCRRWNDYPMSFDVSQEDIIERAKYRRAGERQVRMCASCGACVIIGSSRLTLAKKTDEQGGLFYCDAECADEHRRWRYRTEEYKDLRYGERRRYPSTNVQYANCRVCGCLIASQQSRAFCKSPECRKKIHATYAYMRRFREEFCGTFATYATTGNCHHCGVLFTSVFKWNKKYCTAACCNKAMKANRRHTKRVAAGVDGQWINRRKVFEKARWKCACCNVKTHWPTGEHSQREATLDHVLPLSKGGLHVLENVQLLCRQCNTAKGNRIDEPVQILLTYSDEPALPHMGGHQNVVGDSLTTAAHRGVFGRQKIGLSNLGGSADGRD